MGGYGLDLPVLGQGTVRDLVLRERNFRVVGNAGKFLTGQVRVTLKKIFHILISYVVVKLKCWIETCLLKYRGCLEQCIEQNVSHEIRMPQQM